MSLLHSALMSTARIGTGVVFLVSILWDFKLRPHIFATMAERKYPAKLLLFFGATAWKAIASLALIYRVYPFWAALLLCAYVFVVNVLFHHFWLSTQSQRELSAILFLTRLATCFGLLSIAAAYHY